MEGDEMARKPRVHYEGALYHVICRGNNREWIFKEKTEKTKYLEIIKHYKKKLQFKLYAYCIMDNHVHLLIEVNHIPLSKIMQGIQQVFTQHYNKKYQRTGHVFEQRYKAIHCDKDQYLLGLINYIHMNPVRANMEVGINYQWSSHLAYINGDKIGLLDTVFPLSLFEGNLNQQRKRYLDFMSIEDMLIKEMKPREFSEDIDEFDGGCVVVIADDQEDPNVVEALGVSVYSWRPREAYVNQGLILSIQSQGYV